MSEPGATPNPIDQAYVEAEAALADEAARAARRARVLAAVAAQPAESAQVAAVRPHVARSGWGRGGWLAAAGVAGLAVFAAVRIFPTTSFAPPAVRPPTAQAARQTPPPMASSEAAASRSAPTAAPSPRGITPDTAPPSPPPPRPQPQPQPFPGVSPGPAPSAAPPSMKAAPPATADSAAETSRSEDVVVTAQRRSATLAEAGPANAALEPGVRLRAAAAGGRTQEVKALLAQGAPVDAEDADGDTALLIAVRTGHIAVVALLRHNGASLDHRNHAGESARGLAVQANDADLNKALGLKP